jgi:hypothetical protein
MMNAVEGRTHSWPPITAEERIMSFSKKWKPSAAQKKAFVEKMQDPAEAAAYEARKQARETKRRAGSRFGYETAGGRYVPTQSQYVYACRMLAGGGLTEDEDTAARMVCSAYACNEAVHHDMIHLINEHGRRVIGGAA